MKITAFIAKKIAKPDGLTGVMVIYVMNQMNRKQYRMVEDHLALSSQDTVLEVGFGNGTLIRRLSKQAFHQLYGIDISDDMLALASKKNASKISENRVILTKGSVEQLAYKADFFDKIYTVNTIYFWQDISQCLSEVCRVLKKDGRFINVLYDSDYLNKIPMTKYGFTLYTIDVLVALAEANGLALSQTVQKKGACCLIFEKK